MSFRLPKQVHIFAPYFIAIFILHLFLFAHLPYRIAVQFTDEKLAWIYLFSGLILLEFLHNGNIRKPLQYLWVTTVVLATLLSHWQLGTTAGNIILGFIPFSDAGGYFEGVTTLHGGTLDYFSSRRPLFSIWSAGLIALTGWSFRYPIFLMTAINASAFFYAYIHFRNTFGRISACLVLLVLYSFYFGYIGFYLTEQAGIFFGTLWLVALLNLATMREPSFLSFFSLGAVLTIGLLARAGTFFVIPSLVVALPMVFPNYKWKSASSFCIGVATAVVAQYAAVKMYSGVDGVGYSNFAYVLYGLIKGGTWQLYKVDFSAYLHLPEKELSSVVFSSCLELLKADPSAIFLGAARAYREMFLSSEIFKFGPLQYLRTYLTFAMLACILFSVVAYWKGRLDRFGKLSVFLCLGLFASIPFLPPWDAGMRPYAATIGILAISFIPALRVVSHRLKLESNIFALPPEPPGVRICLGTLSIAIVLLIVPKITSAITDKKSCENSSVLSAAVARSRWDKVRIVKDTTENSDSHALRRESVLERDFILRYSYPDHRKMFEEWTNSADTIYVLPECSDIHVYSFAQEGYSFKPLRLPVPPGIIKIVHYER